MLSEDFSEARRVSLKQAIPLSHEKVELVQRWELVLVWRSRPFLAAQKRWMRRMESIDGGLGFSATRLCRSAASWKDAEHVPNIR